MNTRDFSMSGPCHKRDRTMKKSGGFTLIEVLIAIALSLALLTFLLGALASLRHTLAVAADQAALAERAAQGLSVLAGSAQSGYRPSAITPVSTADPCMSPEATSITQHTPLLVAARGRFPCFPDDHMPPSARLLMIHTLTPCDPTCADAGEPGFLFLEPGCHPVLVRTTPEIRRVSVRQRPADCDAGTAVSVLEPQLFYFRDYAWQPGDGLGAIMMKRLLPDSPVRWSRADTVIAGVTDWSLEPRWSRVRCPAGVHCSGVADGVDVTLGVQGWVRDEVRGGMPQMALTRTLAGGTGFAP